MSLTQAGGFLALGETIVRTHLNLLPSIQQPLEQIAISTIDSIGIVNPLSTSTEPISRSLALPWSIQISAILEDSV
ncbi:hypothetical protein N7491_008690 [Penicillium cf. griseofulvum]|uniref:Uncharacterized protein n=1 Tax=Penicillium cf. griseofulvum TaxID=2972120 RepID=A0A9W9JP71_9EURO|nr:hypothetical protein N7472_005708 [Penicillium cf. griseofulvum]KAJ5423474.1 hypothetical protein N7491_008690 [Penicillium cf. griseofulvum]KAJ5431258.1 hypothetical protein N7445_008990 [Penicillium cf. griseofulvum]